MATRNRLSRHGVLPLLLALAALIAVLVIGSRLSPRTLSDAAARQNEVAPEVDDDGYFRYPPPEQWQKALKDARRPSPQPTPSPKKSG